MNHTFLLSMLATNESTQLYKMMGKNFGLGPIPPQVTQVALAIISYELSFLY